MKQTIKNVRPKYFVILFLTSFACELAHAYAVDPTVAFKAVTQFNTSPVAATSGDWQQSFGAPDGRAVTIVVKAPDATVSKGGTYNVPPIVPGQNVFSYFQSAISRVRTMSPRPSLVVFPSGTYTIAPMDASGALKSLHLDFTNLSDVTFDFSGSRLIFSENVPAAGQLIKPVTGIYVANSQRVAIKNAQIDWSLPGGATLAALGTIRRVGTANVLTIDANYPVTNPALPIRIVSPYDANLKAWIQSPVAETYFSSSYPVQSATDPQTFTSPSFASYPVDSKVVIRYFRFEGHAIMVTGRNTDDISFENVTVFQAPGMGFAFYNPGRGARISGCSVLRNANDPLRLISTVSDAAHLTNSLGDIIFENNDFSLQGDDGLNLTSTINPLQSAPTVDASGNATMTVRYANESYKAGDLIGFFNADMSMVGTAKLISAQVQAGNASIALTVDSSSSAFLPYVSPWSGGASPVFQTMVSDLTLSSNRFVVRNNALHDNRARAALIQSGNGLVQGNSFRNQTLNNAYLASSAAWGEGPGANNVRFVNNTLANSGNTNIGLNAPMLGALIVNDAMQSGISKQPVNQYLVISNNIFDSSPGPAIFIGSAARLNISSNSVTRANQGAAVTSYGSTNTSFPVVLTSGIYSTIQKNTFDLTAPVYPFGVDTTQIDVLSVNVSEDAYLGDAQFNVSLDGGLVAGPLTATAIHSKGQTQNVTFIGRWGSSAHKATVSFLNDAWGGTSDTDRNLYVDSVYYDGKRLNPATAVLWGQGFVDFSYP